MAHGGESSPVADRPDFRQTLAQLKASAQKSNKGAPAYSRYVNRPAGRVLAATGYRSGLTPNQITAISGTLSFAGIAVIIFVRPTPWIGIVVALCLALGYAFDAADGQLARLRRMSSPAGEWLDHMVDAAKISSLHLAVLISWYRFDAEPAGWLLIPLAFTMVAAVLFFGMTLNDQLRRNSSRVTGVQVDRGQTSTIRSLLVLSTDYGAVCVSFLAFGWPFLFKWVYLVLFIGHAGFLLLASVKWFRDMRALPTAGGAA